MIIKYLAPIVFIFLTIVCTAQDSTKIWLHTGVGINAYKGDLSGYEKYTSSFHVGLQLNRKKKVNGSIQVGFGAVNGENRSFVFESNQTPPPSPSRFVKVNFFYLNYDLHYNLIKKNNLIVYLSQGIGMLRFNPEDSDGQSLVDQRSTREDSETYRKETIMLPTSLGAIYLLPNQYGIAVQAGFFNTMTDYLDNISNLGDAKNDNILAFRFAFFVPILPKELPN